uniref:Polynucleotide adenylyltransferase n=1 Tax=Panagrellus redivivus TaxID=6233 RepID=A0A7E4ZQL8_PANRE
MSFEMEVDVPDHHSSVSSSDSRTGRVVCDHCHSDFADVVALQSHAARCSVKAKKAVNARSVYLSGFKRSNDLQSAELRAALNVYGNVEKIIPDHAWHRYAIVQMKTVEEAKKLIQMEWLELGNQRIHIKAAQLKPIPGEFEPQEFTAPQIIAELGKHADTHIIEQLQAMKNAFGIDSESRDWRRSTITFLERLFGKFCSFKVTPQLFGSSISGFGTKYADIDINLTVAPPTEEVPTPMAPRDLLKAPLFELVDGVKATYEELMAIPKKSQLEFFSRIMQDRLYRSHCILSHIKDVTRAKHPLIKFATHSKLLCEMSYENDFSATKAEVLERFTSDKHHILHRIIFVLRLWAQTQDIYGPCRKQRQFYFKSYAFSLLFVAYLQQKKILGPVTVVGSNLMDGWAVDYVFPEFFVGDDDANIIAIIRGFFIFVAQEIPENSVISIRNATIQPFDAFFEANAADERITKGFKKSLLNIQDPLELSHNVCSGVSSDCMSLLKKKAMRALAKLKKAPQGHQIGAIFDLDESACLSIAGSRTDDPEFTFTVDLPKGTSGRLVSNAIDKLMEEVLQFERHEAEDVLPKRRRLNAGYGEAVYSTAAPVWLGRRKLKRELARRFPDVHSWQIEKLVTEALLEADDKARSHAAKNIALVRFSLTTRFDETTPTLTLTFTPSYGERPTYTDVFRFLKQFFTNDNGKLIVDVLRDSVPAMFQELKLTS